MKSTKKSLLLSVLSLVLCFAMLLGTTWAWFTDEVESGTNKIKAGNLDVDLIMWDGNNYESIAGKDAAIFGATSLIAQNNSADTLWEPGKTQIVYLGVRNEGNLALKYNIVLKVADGGLIGSLEYAILDGIEATSAPDLDNWATVKIAAGEAVADLAAGTFKAAEGGVLDEIAYDKTKTNETDYFALAVHMKEDAGNQYKEKDVTIDVNVVATQVEAEEDSFNNQYDAEAQIPVVIASPESINNVLESVKPGSTVMLQQSEQSYGAVNMPTELKDVTIVGEEGVKIEKLNIPQNANIEDLKINDVTFQTANDSCLMVEVKANSKLDIEYKNCKFIGTSTETDQNKSTQMAFNANVGTAEYNLYFDNCEFTNVGRAIYPNSEKCDSVIVKNCKFSGGGAWSIIGNNNSNGFETLVIDNCVFDNVCGVAKFGAKVKNATITNNTFIGNCNQDRSPSKYMFDLIPSVSCIVSGNKVGATADTVVLTDISTGYGITMPSV